MKEKAIKAAKITLIIGATLGFVGLAAASTTFTAPGSTYAYPTNVDAPINTSVTAQGKSGSLSTAGFIDFGTFRIPTGGAAGKVLTSDAFGFGTWQTPAGGGGSVAPWHMSGTDSSPNAQLGTSAVTLDADAGGAIEIGGVNGSVGSGTPYIDFHGAGVGTDYNMRIINNANGVLNIDGGNLKIGGVSVCRQDGTNCPGSSSAGIPIYRVNPHCANVADARDTSEYPICSETVSGTYSNMWFNTPGASLAGTDNYLNFATNCGPASNNTLEINYVTNLLRSGMLTTPCVSTTYHGATGSYGIHTWSSGYTSASATAFVVTPIGHLMP